MFAAAAGASLIAGTISGIATDAAAAHNNNPKLQAQTQTNAKLQMLDSLNEKLIESGAPSGIPYLSSARPGSRFQSGYNYNSTPYGGLGQSSKFLGLSLIGHSLGSSPVKNEV